ncbi:hypothetical protein V8G54_029437 [Vigna mungo]|uniref:Uncharacterized protein n=1 Tax=Vigna mungo TaxID=3915 RepID=A0AAQ3RKB4_VIGMU
MVGIESTLVWRAFLCPQIVSWSLRGRWWKFMKSCDAMEFKVIYIFCEGNSCANKLANLRIDKRHEFWFPPSPTPPPPPPPLFRISYSARGYCINMVLETMKTYSSEDCLTEEAIVTKLRTCKWGEFGEGGLLWGECSSRHFEWFDGNPLSHLLVKVKELYGLGDEVNFRNATVSSGHRARPLTLGTSTQIGAIQTDGIPSLLKVLLPLSCNGLPVL